MVNCRLKLIHESTLGIIKDDSEFVKCTLSNIATTAHLSTQIVIQNMRILVVGDTKWLTMLLGMEDHSGCWCIYCLSSPKEWKELAGSETRIQQSYG